MLAPSDPGTQAELEAWLSPLPQGDLAERAAAFLGRLHGECFGDAGAIRGDLEASTISRLVGGSVST